MESNQSKPGVNPSNSNQADRSKGKRQRQKATPIRLPRLTRKRSAVGHANRLACSWGRTSQSVQSKYGCYGDYRHTPKNKQLTQKQNTEMSGWIGPETSVSHQPQPSQTLAQDLPHGADSKEAAERKLDRPKGYPRSSSREVGMRVPTSCFSPFFSAVYFSRGTLPTE